MKNNQFGRSMLEMLGVLAIIGVLSVGGIAGYSKAMEKWKMNKAIEEYSYLFSGLLENIDEFRRLPNNTGLTEVVEARNLVPETWKKLGNRGFNDANGNLVNIFSRNNRLVIDMYLGGFSLNDEGKGASLSFSPKFCSELMQNVVTPLASVLYEAWFTNSGIAYYGDAVDCRYHTCIRNVSFNDIKEACNYCKKESEKYCGLIFEF